METEPRPQKRMRLGTKSCAECRRRKVRCIYPQGSVVCKECTLHDAGCTAQTPRQRGHVTPEFEQERMRRRLEELEGMVLSLCSVVDPKLEIVNAGKPKVTPDIIRRLQKPYNRYISWESASHIVSDAEESTSTSSADVDTCFESAPLLNLFRAAMFIEKHDPPGPNHLELRARSHVRACTVALLALIPSHEDLDLVLQTTQKYWALWDAFPKDHFSDSSQNSSDEFARVRSFIFDSVESGSGVVAAKAVLYLSLCLQQLPASFKQEKTALPASPKALLASYMNGADTLLSANETLTNSLDGLECFGLQARLYINMGKPQSAWLCLRRAMNFALLQGLHMMDNSANERTRTIWSHIWQYDRQLSLILGLPLAIPDTHPGVTRRPLGQTALDRALFDLSVIGGHLVERNQNRHRVDYSDTERLEQELIVFRQGPGSDFLNAKATSQMPLPAVYGMQTLKISYYTLCKMVQLPYMMQSSSNNIYEHNRLEGLNAARGTIDVWQELRRCCGTDTLIVCDLMDFQVFSAAIVLVVNLLSLNCVDDKSRQDQDWELVNDTSRSLERVSKSMQCNVAGQASQLLDNLAAAHRGAYEGPDTFHATIPYFGKVRISQIKKPDRFASQNTLNNEEFTQQAFCNTVDFDADLFVPFSQNYMGGYLTEAELGVDWTAVLNDDMGYNWSQSFNSAISGTD